MDFAIQAPSEAQVDHPSYQMTELHHEANKRQSVTFEDDFPHETNKRQSVTFEDDRGRVAEYQQANEQPEKSSMKRPSSLHSLR